MLEYLPDYGPLGPGQVQLQKIPLQIRAANCAASRSYLCCEIECRTIHTRLRQLLHAISQPLTTILATAELDINIKPPLPDTALEPTDMQIILMETLRVRELLHELNTWVQKLSLATPLPEVESRSVEPDLE